MKTFNINSFTLFNYFTISVENCYFEIAMPILPQLFLYYNFCVVPIRNIVLLYKKRFFFLLVVDKALF